MTRAAHGLGMRAAVALAVPVLLAAVAAPPSGAADREDAPAHVTEEAQALLDGLVPHVERACGEKFARPPRVRVVSPARASEWFKKDLAPRIERSYRDASAAQRRTVLHLAASSSVASCLARYSWNAKAVLVVPESFDRQRAAAGFEEREARGLLRAVLAHEAVHALDDGLFDLGEAFSVRCPTAESLRALSMVVEGRAVHFGRLAARTAGVAERARMLLPGGDPPRDAGAWTLRLTYEAGAAFVATVVDPLVRFFRMRERRAQR